MNLIPAFVGDNRKKIAHLHTSYTMAEVEKSRVLVSPEELPDKSRSLRARSILKRLETERNKNCPKQRPKRQKNQKMSKYRRKTANAKERDRMRHVNEAFERLKDVLPTNEDAENDDNKSTKVSTLRYAISYINFLQQLIDDSNKGLLTADMMEECALTRPQHFDNNFKGAKAEAKKRCQKRNKNGRKATKSRKGVKKKTRNQQNHRKIDSKQKRSRAVIKTYSSPVAIPVSGNTKLPCHIINQMLLRSLPVQPSSLPAPSKQQKTEEPHSNSVWVLRGPVTPNLALDAFYNPPFVDVSPPNIPSRQTNSEDSCSVDSSESLSPLMKLTGDEMVQKLSSKSPLTLQDGEGLRPEIPLWGDGILDDIEAVLREEVNSSSVVDPSFLTVTQK